jgi:hypothetical protein
MKFQDNSSAPMTPPPSYTILIENGDSIMEPPTYKAHFLLPEPESNIGGKITFQTRTRFFRELMPIL